MLNWSQLNIHVQLHFATQLRSYVYMYINAIKEWHLQGISCTLHSFSLVFRQNWGSTCGGMTLDRDESEDMLVLNQERFLCSDTIHLIGYRTSLLNRL